MNDTQFDIGIRKLKNVFGESKYPKERADLLFKKFKNLPADIFIKGIDNMILSCKFPPLLAEFYDEFNESMRAKREGRVPSRLNTGTGYRKTENGVSGKETSIAIGDILKKII